MIEQGSEAWFAERLGKATASRIADIVATTKSGPSASREDYAVELALERLTGKRAQSFSNAAMQWGTETEPLARAAYEAHTGRIVEEVAMIAHPTIAMSGASPDGLADEGQIEIKCPQSATHAKTLLSKKPAGKYLTQMYWQMACTGRPWCDFISFDPRFPEALQLCVIRINRDDKVIGELERAVTGFLLDVEKIVQQLKDIK